ncbi:MAG: tyrosine-type recombinase/integrase [Steroidobacteraceae bacterium]
MTRAQVSQLLAACSLTQRSRPLRLHAQIMRFAIVLLYTAGLRRGEVIRLTLGDVDSNAGVLRIRDSKFHKSRWVPLSPSATRELQRYLRLRREAGFDCHPDAPLLCTFKGGATRAPSSATALSPFAEGQASVGAMGAAPDCTTCATASQSVRCFGGMRLTRTSKSSYQGWRCTWVTFRLRRPRIIYASCPP